MPHKRRTLVLVVLAYVALVAVAVQDGVFLPALARFDPLAVIAAVALVVNGVYWIRVWYRDFRG